MSNFSSRKQALGEKIDELEETLVKLKQQLKHEIEAEQHEAIDQLEEYLEMVNNKHNNLRGFWQELRKEISELLQLNTEKK